ncbi:MFS transporter [Bosea sp. (in: a-proteobacteria)]|uniref:MFS transporter n=1 Tax=Bosea sp. (in: a-proteobacteria) TaxID=1871050 RepID=UPI0031FEC3E8
MAAAEASHLSWSALSTVLIAMFAITVGYGVALPILPFLIEQIAGESTPQALSWHTGLLTGAYIIAIFVGAPVWGRISDRYGRKPIILVGLLGFAATTAFFAVTESLPLLYLGRFLAGLFAAAITPVAYALIGDYAPSKEWRAHRFALINIAGTAGFFIGPLLGGLAVRVAGRLWALPPDRSLAIPLLTATGLAVIAAVFVVILLPSGTRRQNLDATADAAQIERRAMLRLLAIALVTALAIGVFEVGLALRGKVLGLDAAHIGIMFAECSLVMAVVQALVFSPLIKPELTRWFVAPGLATLAMGLVIVSLVSTSVLMSVAVALVAASAGMLSPVATYWASLGIPTSQGAQLGRMTAAASLGQALGSVAGGALFNLPILPDASFLLAALLVLATLLACIRLPRLLVPEQAASQ